ncbi:hypothetical protein B0T16DRAFT_487185 [Cercophora newfieldiana]|uniref:Uncharacterized protein n=1 Tax=Cercophora newfieldiana TaxID=92897 RepID=A0AA39YPL9_9PEZI|nr:hypothetical protein B0T16DRAFT_487185 [Cercophora newfieldiana]
MDLTSINYVWWNPVAIGSVSDMWSVSAATRTNIVRIKRPSWAELYDIWPAGIFDLQDQLFFTTGYYTWENPPPIMIPIMIRFRGFVTSDTFSPSEPEPRLLTPQAFDFAIFVSSWDTRGEPPQCILVDYKNHRHALTTLQPELEALLYSDHAEFADVLQDHNIPNTSAARMEIPGTDYIALVSFTSRRVSDSRLFYLDDFWEIELHCQYVPEANVPVPGEQMIGLEEGSLFER